MRVAVGVGFGGPSSGKRWDWPAMVDFVREAESLGVDFAWSAESWGNDAVTPLAYLAGKTSRIVLGTGIMQITARTPVMTAMTALTMASLTGGRFALGLGTSGPQVVEGLHAARFSDPLGRLRENIEIIRKSFAGEKIAHRGKHYELPLPDGEGKALRLGHEPRNDIPIYLASLSPRSLELTGELADGWLGTSFIPARAGAMLDYIGRGAAKAGRDMSELDIQAGGSLAICDDEHSLRDLVERRKPALAFTLGAMGSSQHNFYNQAFRRAGYEREAIEVQKLWLDRNREAAVAKVPDRMVLDANLLGTEEMLRERIAEYRDAGVTTLRLAPEGNTLDERVETLAKAMALIRDVCGPA